MVTAVILGLSAQPYSFKIVDFSHQLHDMPCIIFQYFLSLSNKTMLFKNRIKAILLPGKKGLNTARTVYKSLKLLTTQDNVNVTSLDS